MTTPSPTPPPAPGSPTSPGSTSVESISWQATARVEPTARPEPSAQDEALAACLAIEHGAIFGYGVVAAYADTSRRDAIATAAAQHRALRQVLSRTLADSGQEPPLAAAAYATPFPVGDPVSAIQLALRIEEDCASGWLALLERSETDHVKSDSLDALTETAIRAARWREVLVLTPTTVAFPGQAP